MNLPAVTSDDLRWERRELAFGIVALVFFIVSLLLSNAVDLRDKSGAEVVTYFEDRTGLLWTSWLTLLLSGFFFLWFLGAMRASLSRASAGAQRLATTALAAGAVFVAMMWMGRAPNAAIAGFFNFGHEGAQFDPNLASFLVPLMYELWAGAGVAASVYVTATVIAARIGGAFPKWFVRAGYVVAALALVSVVFPYATLSLVMLWSAVAGWKLRQEPADVG